MSKREARNLQRRYQKMGCAAWTSTVVYSGRESERLQYLVHILTPYGDHHTLIAPHERIGGIRETRI